MRARIFIFCIYEMDPARFYGSSKPEIYMPLALTTKGHPSETTAPIQERIELLKLELQQQINAKIKTVTKRHTQTQRYNPGRANNNYDYVDLSQVPVKPIAENDERKKNERYKLRQLATTTTQTTLWTRKTSKLNLWKDTSDLKPTSLKPHPTIPTPYNPLSDDNIAKYYIKQEQEKARAKKLKNKKRKLKPFDRSTSIFYKQRRLLEDVCSRNEYQQWTHCTDLITPFLTGMKVDLKTPEIFGPNSRTVNRLTQLLSMNITRYKKEDIYSILYQISNVQIRLFQWDVPALQKLFDIICKGKKVTYKTLKQGLMNLFKDWHLDITNRTDLLLEARLFRPYCVNLKRLDGSTKTSKSDRGSPPATSTGTPITARTTTCASDDD